MARKSRYSALNQTTDEKSHIWKAGLYIRLSVEDEDNIEQNSIGNQKKIGLHYLKDCPDIILTNIYVDNGYSGMNFKRPDFVQMLKDLNDGEINCVIVKDISRLGRHFLLTSEYVEKIFPEMEVRLISINDGFDSYGKNSDTSQLMMPIKMVMNDSYARDISKKIRSTIHSKMTTGEYLPAVGSIAYGYLRNSKENTFDIDPDAAKIVMRIFEMRAEGLKYNMIARTLNQENIMSPGRLRYSRGLTKNSRFENAEWERKTIQKICSDQVYIGNRVHGRIRRDKLGAQKKKKEEKECLVIEHAHPAIVSETLFEKVQNVNEKEKLLEENKKSRPAVPCDFRNVLRKKVICGDCKSEMKAAKGSARINAKTGSRVFYDCGQYRNSQRRRCSSHYIRQETLISAVRHLLDNQIGIAEDLEQLLIEVRQMPKVSSYKWSLQNKLQGVRRKRESLEQRSENMLVDLTEGVIDREMYEYAKRQYAEQSEQLLIQENEISIEIGALDSTLNTAEKWVNALKEYHKLPEINREIMDELVDHIEVYGNREIKVYLNYNDPFKTVKDYLDQIPEVTKNAR